MKKTTVIVLGLQQGEWLLDILDEARVRLESWFDKPQLEALTGQNLSLTQACYRCISQHIQLCTDDQLRGLPAHTLDGLPRCLSGHALLNLSQLFEDIGLDTSDCWRRFIETRYENGMMLLQCDRHFGIGSYDNDRLFLTSSADCKTYKQRFLSAQCKEMLDLIVPVNIERNHEACEHFLRAYLLCFPFVNRHFSGNTSRLINDPLFEQAGKLFKNVDNFTVSCCFNVKLAFDLVQSNSNLKTLIVSLVDWTLFKYLSNVTLDDDDEMKNEEIKSKENRISTQSLNENHHSVDDTSNNIHLSPADCGALNGNISCDSDLFDDAITCNYGMCNSELEMIDRRVRRQMDDEADGQSEDILYSFSRDPCLCDGESTTSGQHAQSAISRIESLIVTMRTSMSNHKSPLDNTILSRILPTWTRLKKLKFVPTFNFLDHSLWREILVKIGIGQLTHLSIGILHLEDMLSLLLSILFKYYREEDGCQSMELLELCQLELKSNSSILSSSWTVNAVKRLQLSEIRFWDIDARNILHFIEKNTCLTHLTLDNVALSLTQTSLESTSLDESFISTWSSSPYRCLRYLPRLQSLVVKQCRSFYLCEGTNRTELGEVLSSLKSLKNLQLECLEVPSLFVSDVSFLAIVGTLDQLSLSGNHLGESGAILLKQILCTETTSLRSVTLSNCHIPGQALMTHVVENLQEEQQKMPTNRSSDYTLQYLDLDNNDITRQQQQELFTCLRPLVKILFINIHDAYNPEFVAQM